MVISGGRPARKYRLPDDLVGRIDQRSYDAWLQRKATAHCRRDRKRGNSNAIIERYKLAIHNAVVTSGGRDAYTGEALNWEQISTYNNDESRAGRRQYKQGFALLPTVDHLGDGLGPPTFRICGWRTNAAKNDLSHADFVELCRRVVTHFDRVQQILRDASGGEGHQGLINLVWSTDEIMRLLRGDREPGVMK